MSAAFVALLVLGLGFIAWLSGRARAAAFAGVPGEARDRPHSRPGQHGWYVALWTILPAALFLIVWQNVAGHLVYAQVGKHRSAKHARVRNAALTTILNEAKSLAPGHRDGRTARRYAPQRYMPRAELIKLDRFRGTCGRCARGPGLLRLSRNSAPAPRER